MKLTLRDYQHEINNTINSATTNDLVQLDTGAGKTLIIISQAKKPGRVLIVAHRNTLLAQISNELAKYEVRHDIIGSDPIRKKCGIKSPWLRLGKKIDYKRTKFVASIDTLLSRFRRDLLNIDVTKKYLVIIDEAHHVTKKNKWGKLKKIFPNSRFIGFTATPTRLDGQCLHASKQGIFDRLVQAKTLIKDSVHKLITNGMLSDFKTYSVDCGLKTDELEIRYGDYSIPSQEFSIEKNSVVGGAVKEYKRLGKNGKTVVFCVSIKNAEETAQQFQDAGISAAHISSKMTQTKINRILSLFLNNEIKILCNVDIVGEGYDVPGIEVVLMLRKTISFGLYRQWIGRALRPWELKSHAIIIDCVGNVLTHGLPDIHIDWNLFQTQGTTQTNVMPCHNCSLVYEAWLKKCPGCGTENIIDLRKNKGAHYVDLTVINANLCEYKKQNIEEEEKLKQKAKMFEKEIIIPSLDFPENMIGRNCRKLFFWFVENLRGSVSNTDMNKFIRKFCVPGLDFWVSQFTIKDLEKPNNKKCLRIYKKWATK